MEQLQLPVYASCVSKEEPRMETILEIYNRIVGEELRPTTGVSCGKATPK